MGLRALAGVALMAALCAPAGVPAAVLSAPLAPDAVVAGVPLPEWTARWWQWAMSMPVAPFLDPDGRLCEEGQVGPVWFLAGTDGTFNPKRDCVIPTGRHVLVPIINVVQMWRSGTADYRHGKTCMELEHDAAVNNEHLASAVVLLDGRQIGDIARYRVRTRDCFDVEPGDGRMWAAADGYWLMLPPLEPGRHTLQVGANYDAHNVSLGKLQQNFEYVLHVGGRTTDL